MAKKNERKRPRSLLVFFSAILQLQRTLSVILLFLSFFSTFTILARFVMCACEHREIEAFFQLN